MDRQTLMGEYGDEGPVGPKFSRSRIRDDLLPQDRRRLRNILPYIESAMNGYRGALISCLVRTGHPSAADELRGLTIERFIERAKEIRTGMMGRPIRCWRWLTRVELMRDRRDNLRELIERSLGLRGMSNRDVLELADELFDEEIEFAEMLAEDLREMIGTERALNRARRVDSLKERAKEKEEEIGNMYPPPKRLVRGSVRLYNQEFDESPEGRYQKWFQIDMLAEAHGRVDWSWDLTQRELEVAKRAYVQYWWLKGGEETKEGKDMDFYLDEVQTSLKDFPTEKEEESEGISDKMRDKSVDTKGGNVDTTYWGSGSSRAPAPVVRPAMSKEEFTSQISEDVKKPVQRFDVEDVIVGLSAEALEDVYEPKGVVETLAMVIDPDGTIDWVDSRTYEYDWNTREEDLKRAKKELEEKGII